MTAAATGGTAGKGIAAVVTAALLFSLAGLILRSMEAATAWQVVFHRSVSMVVFFLAVIVWRYRRNWLSALTELDRMTWLGGATLGAAMTLMVLAMTHTTIANVLFIKAAQPLVVAVLAWAFLKEHLSNRSVLAIVLAMTGVTVTAYDGISGGRGLGDILALFQVLAISAFFVLLRAGRHIDMAPAMLIGSGLAMVVSGAVSGVGGGSLSVSVHDLVLCWVLGWVQMGSALLLFAYGAKLIPAAEVSLLGLSENIAGPLLVFLAFNEQPTVIALGGGALVLGVVALTALDGLRRHVTRRGAGKT